MKERIWGWVMLVGESVPRLEDDRLLRGMGRFVDDIDVPAQLHMHVVRADVAHASIEGVRADAAMQAPGVRLVVTADDIGEVPRIPLRLDFGVELDPFLQPVLARDRVRYVGEPVAMVLAEDPYVAEDAAERVHVEYEELPVVLDARAALADGAPSLWEGRGNEAVCLRKAFGDVDAAFAAAAHVVSDELSTSRHSGVPLETRGLVASWERGREHLTVWGAALVTHYHRRGPGAAA